MATVSVVIPLFNKEFYVSRAINSVLSQSFQNFELIVIDDGSTDNSAKIVRQYQDSRIKLIQQNNAGECAARNRGLLEAQCDLVAFLDADDAYYPNFLEIIDRLRKKFPECGAYATAINVCKKNSSLKLRQYKGIPPYPWEGIIPDYFFSLLGESPISSSSVAVPKSVFEKTGFFPEREKKGGDLDTWLRIAFQYPIAFSNSIGSVYYQNLANRACVIYKNTDYKLIKTIQSAIVKCAVSEKTSVHLLEYANKFLLKEARTFIELKQYHEARIILKKCRTKYYWRKKYLYLCLSYLPTSVLKAIVNLKNTA